MTGSASQPRAVIAGGSVGGLFAGVMLARQGWRVDIFERAHDGLEARGAGIAGHDELTAILQAIEVTSGQPAGMDVSGRVALDRHGNELAAYDYPQYLTSWSLIFNMLHAAFEANSYHPGLKVLDVGEEGGQATAVLSSGETVSADLVIGADGARSQVRGKLAPDVQPEYGGYVAWRGVVDEAALSPSFMTEAFGRYSFCFPPGGQFIGYPMAGQNGSVQPGSRRYNFLWYRHAPEGAALDRLLSDETGHRHDHSIPPMLIRSDNIEAMRADAASDLPPHLAEVVTQAESYLLQPIYDVESRHISFGRIALVGDAAFVCRPHVGIGVLKAAQDAMALAESMREASSVPDGLADYERRRLQDNVDAVEFGRHLGSFIERGLGGPTSDPSLGLTYDYIVRESARLPRVKPRRAGAAERRLQ